MGTEAKVETARQAALSVEMAALREAAERCRELLGPRDEPGLPLALIGPEPGRT